MKKKFLTITVIGLILLSGCSLLTPDNPTPNQDKNQTKVLTNASQSHMNASTVVVNKTIEQQYSISGEESVYNQETTAQQATTTTYNFTSQSYYTNGTVSQTIDGGTPVEQSITKYFVNGTQYTEINTQNESRWRTQEKTFSRNLLLDIETLTEPNNTKIFNSSYNNSTETYIYTADLTNNSTVSTVFGEDWDYLTSSQSAWLTETADTFTATILVSENETIKSISINLENQITYNNTKENVVYNDIPENTTISISFKATQQFSEYNNSQPITLPKNTTSN